MKRLLLAVPLVPAACAPAMNKSNYATPGEVGQVWRVTGQSSSGLVVGTIKITYADEREGNLTGNSRQDRNFKSGYLNNDAKRNILLLSWTLDVTDYPLTGYDCLVMNYKEQKVPYKGSLFSEGKQVGECLVQPG